MADKTKPHRDQNLDADDPDVRSADQAEGERGDKTSVTVERTPGSAEGERNEANQDEPPVKN